MNEHRLLLASQSPRRHELLALLGLPFVVVTPDVPEIAWQDESPVEFVIRLSRDKAQAACTGYVQGKQVANRSTVVIACDTVVALDGGPLGKPGDATEATGMLRRLREQSSHAVYSAVTLLEPATNRALTDVAETQLEMRAYTDAEIAAYVASGDPLDKAGAYAIQHPGFHPVAKLQGCYANVMGLPLCHLSRCMQALGIEPSCDVPTACRAHTGYACSVYAAILDAE